MLLYSILRNTGLYYGQYMSQYCAICHNTAREIALKNKPQTSGQLLLGVNDKYAATQMHLRSIEWNTASERTTNQFLVWVKHNVAKGYPVAIGIYTRDIKSYLYIIFLIKSPHDCQLNTLV